MCTDSTQLLNCSLEMTYLPLHHVPWTASLLSCSIILSTGRVCYDYSNWCIFWRWLTFLKHSSSADVHSHDSGPHLLSGNDLPPSTPCTLDSFSTVMQSRSLLKSSLERKNILQYLVHSLEKAHLPSSIPLLPMCIHTTQLFTCSLDSLTSPYTMYLAKLYNRYLGHFLCCYAV